MRPAIYGLIRLGMKLLYLENSKSGDSGEDLKCGNFIYYDNVRILV